MKAQRRLKNMKIVRRADGFPRPRFGKQILVSLLSLALLFATWPQNLSANHMEYWAGIWHAQNARRIT